MKLKLIKKRKLLSRLKQKVSLKKSKVQQRPLKRKRGVHFFLANRYLKPKKTKIRAKKKFTKRFFFVFLKNLKKKFYFNLYNRFLKNKQVLKNKFFWSLSYLFLENQPLISSTSVLVYFYILHNPAKFSVLFFSSITAILAAGKTFLAKPAKKWLNFSTYLIFYKNKSFLNFFLQKQKSLLFAVGLFKKWYYSFVKTKVKKILIVNSTLLFKEERPFLISEKNFNFFLLFNNLFFLFTKYVLRNNFRFLAKFNELYIKHIFIFFYSLLKLALGPIQQNQKKDIVIGSHLYLWGGSCTVSFCNFGKFFKTLKSLLSILEKNINTAKKIILLLSLIFVKYLKLFKLFLFKKVRFFFRFLKFLNVLFESFKLITKKYCFMNINYLTIILKNFFKEFNLELKKIKQTFFVDDCKVKKSFLNKFCFFKNKTLVKKKKFVMIKKKKKKIFKIGKINV